MVGGASPGLIEELLQVLSWIKKYFAFTEFSIPVFLYKLLKKKKKWVRVIRASIKRTILREIAPWPSHHLVSIRRSKNPPL